MNYTKDIMDKECFLKPIENLVNIPNKKSTEFTLINPKQRMKYQKEIDLLSDLIHMEPDKEVHFERRGDLHFKMGHFYKAALDYIDANNLCLGEDFYRARFHCARGMAFENANHLDDAWQEYKGAVGFDFYNSYYYFCRGRIEIKLKKNGLAVRTFKLASDFEDDGGPGTLPEIQVIKGSAKTRVVYRFKSQKIN